MIIFLAAYESATTAYLPTEDYSYRGVDLRFVDCKLANQLPNQLLL